MQRVVAEPETIRRFLREIKESPVGEVRIPVRVANLADPSRHWEADFLVDTGATTSVVPVDILNAIGIEARWLSRFWLADESSIMRRVGLAEFTVAGITDGGRVMFGQEGQEPILGNALLQDLGLLVDPTGHRILHRSVLAGR